MHSRWRGCSRAHHERQCPFYGKQPASYTEPRPQCGETYPAIILARTVALGSEERWATLTRTVGRLLPTDRIVQGLRPYLAWSVELLATSRGPRHGRRDRDGPAHDRGRANGRCRGPRGPNVLGATPSLRDSDRSADGSSMPLQTGVGPNVPGPTCSGDPPVPNSRLSKRNLRWEAVQAPHRRPQVAVSRCTPKSVLNSARR